MRDRFFNPVTTVTIGGGRRRRRCGVCNTHVGAGAVALKTPWGEPDLQGIWTDENDTPLQRSPRFANQEFFTEAQRAELDRAAVAELLGRDERGERGTELDVAGAYNYEFVP